MEQRLTKIMSMPVFYIKWFASS